MDPTVQVLVNIEGLLEQILSYLPVVELLPKSRVCICWQRTVRKILQRRSRCSAVDFRVLISDHEKQRHFPTTSSSSRRTSSKRLKLLTTTFDDQIRSIKEEFLDWRKQWKQTPKIVLLFCKSVKANCDLFVQTAENIYALFCKYLPKDCVVVMVKGCMCCSRNYTIRTEALSFLSSCSSSINVLNWLSVRTEASRKKLLASIKDFVLAQSDLKILIFFYDISKVRWFNEFFISFLKKELNMDSNVVILGCDIYDSSSSGIVHSQKHSNTVVSLLGNAITSEKNGRHQTVIGGQFLVLTISGASVCSASMLADSEVKTISELPAKMKVLRRSMPSTVRTDNSFGIIVSCIDRMHETMWYNDYEHAHNNVEITALQNEFPGLPVLTMHSLGEVGGNFNLVDSASVEPEQLIHTEAAIFTVVHING